MTLRRDLRQLSKKIRRDVRHEREEFIKTLPTDFDKKVAWDLCRAFDFIQKRSIELIMGYGVDPEEAAKQAGREYEEQRQVMK